MSAPERVAPDPLIGEVLGGKYRLISRVGSGGMGTVYKAHHVGLDKAVAVKVLTGCFVDPWRFVQEARAACKVEHPNVVKVIDCEWDSNSRHPPFIVMDLLNGECLRDRLLRVERLEFAATLEVMLPVMKALGVLHRRNVVHRDLKPENIFLHKDRDAPEQHPEVPILLDFGIAKVWRDDVDTGVGVKTGSQAWFGSIGYTPPGASSEAHAGTDQFSAGIIIYECLAGSNPLLSPESRNLAAYSARAWRSEDHLVAIGGQAGIPVGIDAILRRMTSLDAATQFPTMEAAAAALASLTSSETGFAPTVAAPDPPSVALSPRPTDLPRSRAVHPGLAAGAGLVVLGGAVALGYWAFGTRSDTASAVSETRAESEVSPVAATRSLPASHAVSSRLAPASAPAQPPAAAPASAARTQPPASEPAPAQGPAKSVAIRAARHNDISLAPKPKAGAVHSGDDEDVDVQLEKLLDKNERRPR